MSGRKPFTGTFRPAVLFMHGSEWHLVGRATCLQQTAMVSSVRKDVVEGEDLAGRVVGPPLRCIVTDAWLMTCRGFLTKMLHLQNSCFLLPRDIAQGRGIEDGQTARRYTIWTEDV